MQFNVNGKVEVSRSINDIIMKYLQRIDSGTLTIIVQDEKVMQVTIDEFYDFDEDNTHNGKKETAAVNKAKNINNITQDLVNRLVQVLKTLKFGDLTVNIRSGKIIGFEKNEKFRIK